MYDHSPLSPECLRVLMPLGDTDNPDRIAISSDRTISKPGMLDDTCQRIISWVLVAQEPLSIFLIQSLLLVGDHMYEVEDIEVASRALLVIRGGAVVFSSESVRDILLHLSDRRSLEQIHRDLVTRLLRYCRDVPFEIEPGMTDMKDADIARLLKECPALEYAYRHWIHHLHSSLPEDGQLPYTRTELSECFPTSALLARLQRRGEAGVSPKQARYRHALAMRICQLAVDDGPSLVQSRINVAQSYQRLGFFKRAARHHLDAASSLYCPDLLSAACVSVALLCLEQIDATSICTADETNLRNLIESRGVSDAIAIRCIDGLVQLRARAQGDYGYDITACTRQPNHIICALGHGGSGDVWLAMINNRECVIKMVYSHLSHDYFSRELAIYYAMMWTDIPGVLQFRGVCDKTADLFGDYAYHHEYLPYGLILDWPPEVGGLESLSAAEVESVRLSARESLDHLHDAGIVHGGVEWRSIGLVTDGSGLGRKAVFLDFGHASLHRETWEGKIGVGAWYKSGQAWEEAKRKDRVDMEKIMWTGEEHSAFIEEETTAPYYS